MDIRQVNILLHLPKSCKKISPQLAWIIQHNTIFLLQVEIQFELLLRMFKSLSNVRTIPISQTANWLSELNIVQTSIMQNFAAGRVQWQVS